MKFNLFNYTVREYFDEQYEDFKQQKMKGDVIG